MKPKYIFLAIISCIMVYDLALPFIEPSQEIMRCNEDYICSVEQRYLGYNKSKTYLSILDKDNAEKTLFRKEFDYKSFYYGL